MKTIQGFVIKSLIHAVVITQELKLNLLKSQKKSGFQRLTKFQSNLNIEHIGLRKRHNGSKLILKSHLKYHNSCSMIWREIYFVNFWLVQDLNVRKNLVKSEVKYWKIQIRLHESFMPNLERFEAALSR